ncbi:hypothetical protein NPIL_314551 [Nephila pilipes]|uniref:Uncharacterized protein n=1 Tax=Nephila pilipes TaxID=299642 RepID=A0A8X6U2H5_NEPPI|nr:hypothetical protein NPIL_314551 [Nephila pilipes]
MVTNYVDPGQSRRVGRPSWGCTTERAHTESTEGVKKKLVASTESRLDGMGWWILGWLTSKSAWLGNNVLGLPQNAYLWFQPNLSICAKCSWAYNHSWALSNE